MSRWQTLLNTAPLTAHQCPLSISQLVQPIPAFSISRLNQVNALLLTSLLPKKKAFWVSPQQSTGGKLGLPSFCYECDALYLVYVLGFLGFLRKMDGGMIDSELSDSMDRVSRFTGLGQDFCRAGFASECDWNSRFSGFEIGRFERVFPFNGFVDDGIDKVVGRSVGREQFDGRSRLLLPCREFDPRVLLNNLVFIEQKVRDLQGVVKEMIRESCNLAAPSGELQQQMVVEEIASIIVQVVSIARRLIHGGQQGDLGRSEANPVIGQLSDLLGTTTDLGFSSSGVELGDNNCNHMEINHQICARSMVDNLSGNPRGSLDLGSFGEGNGANRVEEPVYSVQEIEDCLAGYMDFADKTKDEYNEGEEENLRSCCYEILELEKEEILAPHTHFCLICGKGFKRDANLRMHMRGHGDIYKTPEALSNPNKGAELNNVHSRRYSCPFEGCKRNQKHKKFQPLKTILCVKNHYKRSHCDKSYVCSRCHSKRFSVLADLRTHEKHCGEDKWQCSCGTTFSRKDKLFGHVTLFQGHTPVVPVNEAKGGSASDDGAKIERKKNSEKIGTEVLTTDLGVNSNAVGQFISGPAPAPSADYSSTVGYENGEFLSNQSVLTNIRLPKEDNKPNYYNGILERMDRSPQSSPTLVGGPFSLHALLSCDFIEANGRSPNSDGV